MTTQPPDAPPVTQPARACLVRLAGALVAVDVRYAREVVVFEEYTPVPLAPAHLIGVVNLRGQLMPLVDIRAFLGLELARATRDAKALVVEHDHMPAAFLIDDAVGLETLESLSGPDREAGAFTVGRLEREGETVTLLDVARILGAVGGTLEATREEG
jgi:chemotaxis signal transduction protein